MSDDAG